MREILFRGKRIDNGKWITGSLWTDIDRILILPAGSNVGCEVIPETIGQYTGLTDKNGKRIFEGDICRFREWRKGAMCWVGKVYYEHQQFVISGERNMECSTSFTLPMSRFSSEDIEVVGNIHDNLNLSEAYCER